MPEDHEKDEPEPQPAEHLRLVSGDTKWADILAPLGLVLLLLVLVLTFVAPSVLWFLLYPVLILGALAALATAAAWLLRHF